MCAVSPDDCAALTVTVAGAGHLQATDCRRREKYTVQHANGRNGPDRNIANETTGDGYKRTAAHVLARSRLSGVSTAGRCR